MTGTSDTTRVRICPARQADVAELLHLEQVCFTDYYERHRFGDSEFRDYIQGEDKIIWLATLDGDLAAYVAGTVESSRAKPAAHMDSLAVMPRFRERGIGDCLLRAFAREVNRRGCLRILITVATANENGIVFFANRGFRRVRKLADYYDKGVDGILMRLET